MKPVQLSDKVQEILCPIPVSSKVLLFLIHLQQVTSHIAHEEILALQKWLEN